MEEMTMEPTQRVSAAAIQSLKEALGAAYWYKNDLKSFLLHCLADKSIVNDHANWDDYKRQIVSDVINHLCADQERFLGDLRRLFHEVSRMDNFAHLERLDGGAQKAQRAREAVAALRALVRTHDAAVKHADNAKERQNRESGRLAQCAAVREKIDELKQRYFVLVSKTGAQKRGFELERLLYDIFELFDLDPKASFRNTGEQVDGAFAFDSTDWLFEAKWHTERVGASALDSFAAKVRRKLDNTLGLFLSINGFSSDGITAHSQGRPVIILMTGCDLVAVLEERIDFVSLLKRKKQHAGRTGDILLEINQFDA